MSSWLTPITFAIFSVSVGHKLPPCAQDMSTRTEVGFTLMFAQSRNKGEAELKGKFKGRKERQSQRHRATGETETEILIFHKEFSHLTLGAEKS